MASPVLETLAARLRSELGDDAVLTDRANQMKLSTLSQHLRPRLAVVDPELTYGLPPEITASTSSG